MKYLIILLSFIGLFSACKAKPTPVENTSSSAPVDLSELDRLWKKIDSLEQKGLATSALEVVREIKQKALAGNVSGHLVKAVVHENKYLNQLEEDATILALQRGETEVSTYPEPARSVMHSLLAQWYQNYLQGHIWQLRNTTEYTGPAGDDIRTWGIRHFIDRIQHHYAASVQWPGLKVAPVDQYTILLTEAQNTDALRPTLYDILMHRALDYFSAGESFLTKPAYDYTLTDPAAFGAAQTFIHLPLPTADTVNHTWKSLTWFRELLAFRQEDKSHPAALLDADLKRLRFVYDHIITDGKDSLYERALTQLAETHASLPDVALVNYQIAALWTEQASRWQIQDSASRHRDGYVRAKALCEKTIAAYPAAYGSQLCKNLLLQIEQKNVSATIESIQLPKEDMLARIEYRNLKSVFARIVKLPESPRRWKQETWDGDIILNRLNQLPVARAWTQSLAGTEDYQPHATEIAIAALDLGHYALVLSDQESFAPRSSTTGAMFFTVSELGYWFIDDRENSRQAAVVNRRTGQPLEGVLVEFFTYEYNANLRRQQENKIGEDISDKHGWVDAPSQHNRNLILRLTRQGDELHPDDSYYTYHRTQSSTNQVTLLFTDRAIYRPGQQMHFKGYALDVNPQGLPSIVANKKIDVVLRDANGQEVSKQSFASNSFGTFAGHFDLPRGGLTGVMSITATHGDNSHAFRVEEYKRPKFEVTFDTIKQNARLDEMVSVTGIAKDYAGSPVPGAAVGYRVERVSYRPWWYGYYYRHWPMEDDRQVLAVGQALTDDAGKVNVQFEAKSKPGADEAIRYRFEVTLYITDITGESHEATKTISLNKQGFDVNIPVNDKILLDSLRRLEVEAYNSDGAKVDVTATVDVKMLRGPQQHKRNRLWTAPDVLTISNSDYASRFPDYHHPKAEHMRSWPVERNMGSRLFTVKGESILDISPLVNTPGFYSLHWTLTDAAGKKLEITQYTMVYAADQLLPGHEVLQINWDNRPYEPGETVMADVLTGIPNAPKALKITEHKEANSEETWLTMPAIKHASVKLAEADRGGVAVTYLAVYNNRFYQQQHLVQVPWTNKELTVALKTWRDKLEPGDDESWTITVSGKKGEQVTAEMLMSMYDASLDAFVPHEWGMSLYPTFNSTILIQGAEARDHQYWGLSNNWIQQYQDVPVRQYRDINTYGYYPEGYYPYYRGRPGGVVMRNAEAMDGIPSAQAAPANADMKVKEEALNVDQAEAVDMTAAGEGAGITPTAPPLRTALEETVFFYPQMQTDDKGNLQFTFKMKEGLTRWKFQALAHTKQLAYGWVKQEVVTQKDLMVFPNPPRFFRAGDTIAFQVKVTNLSEADVAGTARLKIVDAFTNEDLSGLWKIARTEQPVSIKESGSSALSWMLHVPRDWTRPVKYQVQATAGTFTDGEESFLPVVTNRILVTETLPLPLKAKETRTFVFRSMLENTSTTMDPHQYVVEMTSSPAWYAVQALPYLMEYPHECAEQIFSRLYANTLASHIATKYPAIKQVYDGWRNTGDDALLSNLQKNQDLKSAMLEETPWVRDAMGETQQKKDIALLFDGNRINQETRQAFSKLQQMQLSNGGFPWFPEGRDSWYITQYIVEGFGHLKKMGVTLKGVNPNDIVNRAVPYLDNRMIEWYEELKKLEQEGKLKLSDHNVTALQVHYMYVRSFYPDVQRHAKMDEINAYVRSQVEKYWLQHSLYEQGLIALATFRQSPNAQLARDILASLREKTIVHE
jgi:hypothetical protein